MLSIPQYVILWCLLFTLFGSVWYVLDRRYGVDQQRLYETLMATAESKTAEFDARLDEEGRFVKNGDERLAKDESVFIRTDSGGIGSSNDKAAGDDGALARSDASATAVLEADEGAEAAPGRSVNLFGQEDDDAGGARRGDGSRGGAAKRGAKKKTKTKVVKKVVRKRKSGGR